MVDWMIRERITHQTCKRVLSPTMFGDCEDSMHSSTHLFIRPSISSSFLVSTSPHPHTPPPPPDHLIDSCNLSDAVAFSSLVAFCLPSSPVLLFKHKHFCFPLFFCFCFLYPMLAAPLLPRSSSGPAFPPTPILLFSPHFFLCCPLMCVMQHGSVQ